MERKICEFKNGCTFYRIDVETGQCDGTYLHTCKTREDFKTANGNIRNEAGYFNKIVDDNDLVKGED